MSSNSSRRTSRRHSTNAHSQNTIAGPNQNYSPEQQRVTRLKTRNQSEQSSDQGEAANTEPDTSTSNNNEEQPIIEPNTRRSRRSSSRFHGVFNESEQVFDFPKDPAALEQHLASSKSKLRTRSTNNTPQKTNLESSTHIVRSENSTPNIKNTERKRGRPRLDKSNSKEHTPGTEVPDVGATTPKHGQGGSESVLNTPKETGPKRGRPKSVDSTPKTNPATRGRGRPRSTNTTPRTRNLPPLTTRNIRNSTISKTRSASPVVPKLEPVEVPTQVDGEIQNTSAALPESPNAYTQNDATNADDSGASITGGDTQVDSLTQQQKLEKTKQEASTGQSQHNLESITPADLLGTPFNEREETSNQSQVKESPISSNGRSYESETEPVNESIVGSPERSSDAAMDQPMDPTFINNSDSERNTESANNPDMTSSSPHASQASEQVNTEENSEINTSGKTTPADSSQAPSTSTRGDHLSTISERTEISVSNEITNDVANESQKKPDLTPTESEITDYVSTRLSAYVDQDAGDLERSETIKPNTGEVSGDEPGSTVETQEDSSTYVPGSKHSKTSNNSDQEDIEDGVTETSATRNKESEAGQNSGIRTKSSELHDEFGTPQNNDEYTDQDSDSEDQPSISTNRQTRKRSDIATDSIPTKRTKISSITSTPDPNSGSQVSNRPDGGSVTTNQDSIIDVSNLAGARREKIQKKAAGNLIDRHWDPLPGEVLRIIERLMAIAMNKAVERFPHEGKWGQVRIREAQNALNAAWMNAGSGRAFMSRLASTNLPTLNSMQPTRSSAFNGGLSGSDLFNLDQLTNRKHYLETYLSAEIEQLHELEVHYNNLESIYHSDLTYLNEFRKTTSINEQKMQNEMLKKKKELELDTLAPSTDEINLKSRDINTKLPEAKFDPNEDAEVKDLLVVLNKHVSSMSSNTSALATLNEKIEVLYNVLEML